MIKNIFSYNFFSNLVSLETYNNLVELKNKFLVVISLVYINFFLKINLFVLNNFFIDVMLNLEINSY